MPEHVLSPVWSEKPRGMSDMRRLAKRVVDSMPKVQAVVLFGSRARKTARRDSDWDVALLAPERYRKEVLRSVTEVPAVSYITLSPKRLRERHNWLGTLERSVAEGGVLLAGEWIIPKSQKRPFVSYPNLAIFLDSAAERVDIAVRRVQIKVLRYGLSPADSTLCKYTQDAAERLAKAALLHLCVHPASTHGVLELAQSLLVKHPDHPWIEVIKSFNGLSKEHHVENYEFEETESTDEALDRLYRVMTFYEEVLETIAQKRLGFAGHVLSICMDIEVIVSFYLRHSASWNKFPDELKQHLLQWKRMAVWISGTLSDGGRTGK